MATKRITQSDIARDLRLSRNTVSKVLNNLPGIAEETRQVVIEKSIELGYRSAHLRNLSLGAQEQSKQPNTNIAFICHSDSFTGSFWPPILRSVEKTLSEQEVNLRIVIIRPEEESTAALPSSLTSPMPHGIITAGLFHSRYYKKIAALGLPMISLDISTDIYLDELICDVVLMQNTSAVYRLTENLIKKGHKNIAFAGDKNSCQSFYERFQAYQSCMLDTGTTINPNLVFDSHSDSRYYNPEEIYNRLNGAELPTAFICANDQIALAVHTLRFAPYNLFDEIDICGFDNTSELIALMPEVSTVATYPEEIGQTLAEQVLWRIRNPGRNFRCVRTDVKPIFRCRAMSVTA